MDRELDMRAGDRGPDFPNTLNSISIIEKKNIYFKSNFWYDQYLVYSNMFTKITAMTMPKSSLNNCSQKRN